MVSMQLNTLRPAPGSKKNPKRVGRGIGSGFGKTCGRGHKGFKARAGSGVKVGFEGGQMPLHRRMPKFGFTSRKSLCREEVRLSDLMRCPIDAAVIDLDVLKAAGVVKANTKCVKVFLSGDVTRAVVLSGIPVTKGAHKAIIDAGGRVE